MRRSSVVRGTIISRLTGRGSPARLLAMVIASLSLLQACHEVTEYSSAGENSVLVISPDDLTLVTTLENFEGARSLASQGSGAPFFFVACNSGMLYKLDSGDFELFDQALVGPDYPPGYGEMLSVGSSRLYLVLGYGLIGEINADGCNLVHDFVTGSSPVALASDGSHLYVGDGMDGVVREVSLSTYNILRECSLPEAAGALCWYDSDAGVLAAACPGSQDAYLVTTEDVFSYYTVALLAPSSDVAAMSDTTIACFTHPVTENSRGFVTFMTGDIIPWDITGDTLRIQGDPVSVCCSQQRDSFFVTCLTGGGTRVFELDAMTWSVLQQADFPGVAIDAVLHGNENYLLVLVANP